MTNTASTEAKLADLQATDIYRKLTPKQQKAVTLYIESNGDKTFAIMNSYNAKDEATASRLGYEVFSLPGIVDALNFYFGVSPANAFRAEVARACRNPKLSVAAVRALELKARVFGYDSGNFADLQKPAQTFAVGDRVTQRDDAGVTHTGIVKSVDRNGRATNIEEIQS